MSAVVQVIEGYPAMLRAWLDGLDAYAHLYTNDPPLTADTVADDFEEVVYDDYFPLPVERWTEPALRDGRAFAIADPMIFSYVAGDLPPPVRGYYVTSGRDGPLLWAWRKAGEAYQLAPDTPTVIVYVTARWPLALV